ncbi:hypothetical protein PP613_23355 [Mycobacteroides abscessus]|nr:hypothetical protein [Mycobacteroides abscessus]MDM2412280.1 hypothetical protein [Mycobacteroides abscessus]
MTTVAIPPARIGVGADGLPLHIAVDEFSGTDLCIVAGGPGSGTTNMLMLLGSAWSAHLNVVIVGAGIYRAPFERLAPRQLPEFLAHRRQGRRTAHDGPADTVLLLDHFLPAQLEVGPPEPSLPLDFGYKPVSLDELDSFDPALLDDAGLHVVMRWPRSERSWMQTTEAWNTTAAVVIGLATPGPAGIDETDGRDIGDDDTLPGSFLDRRDGRRPRAFTPGTYRC